jgi:hypothetical protein
MALRDPGRLGLWQKSALADPATEKKEGPSVTSQSETSRIPYRGHGVID